MPSHEPRTIREQRQQHRWRELAEQYVPLMIPLLISVMAFLSSARNERRKRYLAERAIATLDRVADALAHE